MLIMMMMMMMMHTCPKTALRAPQVSPNVGLNSYNHPKSALQVSAFVQLWALTWGADLGWL